MTKVENCMFRNCNIKLKEEYDKWYLHVLGQLKVYCERHYNQMENKLNNNHVSR